MKIVLWTAVGLIVGTGRSDDAVKAIGTIVYVLIAVLR